MECLIRTSHYEAVRPTNKTVFIIFPTDNNQSDADPDRVPNLRVRVRDEQGLVNYHEDADEATERMWREKLGRYLYDYVVKPDMERQGVRPPSNPDKVYIVGFPVHYKLWVQKKGHPHDPRKDYYLYGSRFVPHFRSPMEFCLHLKWILDGQPKKVNGRPDCRCRYCDGTVRQAEISEGLGRYHPAKRDRDRRDRDGDGRRRPRAPRAAPTTSIPFKDYTKLNPASAA